MLKRRFIYTIVSICLATASFQLQSCKKQEIPVYNSGSYLHFDKTNDNRTRIDTAYFSFSHFPSKEEVTTYFKVSLIGHLLSEDKEYKVKVLSGNDPSGVPYTTAKEEQYAFEKLIFRKGVYSDSLAIKVFKDKVPSGKEYYLTIRLVANESFDVGYYQNTDIKLRFDNKTSKPLWWTNEITGGYFGEFSEKKLATIMLANPGFVSTEGMSMTEKTKIGLKTKEYIIEHNVTEENGDPMVIPIY